MSLRRSLVATWLLGLLGGLLPGLAISQLSPGELSEPHAAIDGSSGCLQCHSAGKGVDATLCLTCHTPLRRRLAAGQGLHARKEYQDCESCHIEHHGREFEIVWWGREGEAAFDHRLAGYELEGAHGALACRDCHRGENIAMPTSLLAVGKDLDRTFLGLDTACLSCHSDEHRGQFEPSSCLSCHGLETWSAAALFDHDRASFRLTGRHRDVSCERCHATIEPTAGEAWAQYRGIAATRCTDCHSNPHQRRLSDDCSTCHVTDGWQRIDQQGFDHDLTRYPLRGRHRNLACESCHGNSFADSGLAPRITGFDRCDRCHADPHLAQFRGRQGGDDCTACHGLDGFLPANFGLEEHQRSAYPLDGAHLAVPCPTCHGTVPAEDLVAPVSTHDSRLPTEARQFRFASTACPECHRDPHLGDADAHLGNEGCVSCHQLSSWRRISFDHVRTGYELTGRHRALVCTECHQPEDSDVTSSSRGPSGAGARVIRLSTMPSPGAVDGCRQCHEDPHFGQFDADPSPAACTDCHTSESWEPTGFDHDRDSLFALHGAHQNVACATCHPTEWEGATSFVRYRPLGRACADCHGSEVVGDDQ